MPTAEPDVKSTIKGELVEMTSGPSDLVAAHIQSVRRQQGITAQQLAARCAAIGARHLTAAVIANIETGRRDVNGVRRRDITIDELFAAALALDVQPVDLVGPCDGWLTVQVTPDVQATPADIAAWVRGESTSVVPSLLGGLALCGACHTALLARRNADGIFYFCANASCPRPRINRAGKLIDSYISGLVLGFLQRPESIEQLIPGANEGRRYFNAEIVDMDLSIEDLKQRRTKTQQELESLADHPHLSADVLARSLASFNQKIQVLEAKRAETWRRALLVRNQGMIEDVWKKLPLAERRSMIEITMTVTLVPLLKGENVSDRASGQVLDPEKDLRISYQRGGQS